MTDMHIPDFLTGDNRHAFNAIMTDVIRKNPNEPEFHQAVAEVYASLVPYVMQHPKYQKAKILDRLTEPDRSISFRVVWEDDNQDLHVNRGYRVQFNSAIGPYKGGLRFSPTVNLSIFKFLGFEQIFKNSLTTLPIGGGKGGADFDPKGKSDSEIMRFCHAYMTELHRHIGNNVDVPAGDIGVGAREIGYLFGQYKRVTNKVTGVLTGKSIPFGGSLIRPEATGYGCVYFVDMMLAYKKDSIKNKRVLISGAGNVAYYAAEKALQLGAQVITLSDSSGFVYEPDGFTHDQLVQLAACKRAGRSVGAYTNYSKTAQYYPCETPWRLPCDIALPCATQNELNESDAKQLVESGCIAVGEGANMPVTPAGISVFNQAGVAYGPGKAANAGGVSVSALEMSQNSMRLSWTQSEIEEKLQLIMKRIHDQCVEHGTQPDGSVNYALGANIAGFKKVADAMIAFGAI